MTDSLRFEPEDKALLRSDILAASEPRQRVYRHKPEETSWDGDSGLLDELFGLLERPEWMLKAACRGVGAELYYGTRGSEQDWRVARRVCAGCPVVVECLEYALDNGEKYGIWGAKSEKERKRMRKARRDAA